MTTEIDKSFLQLGQSLLKLAEKHTFDRQYNSVVYLYYIYVDSKKNNLSFKSQRTAPNTCGYDDDNMKNLLSDFYYSLIIISWLTFVMYLYDLRSIFLKTHLQQGI